MKYCLFLTIWLLSILKSINSQSAQDLVDITNITIFPQDYQHKIYAGYLNITPFGKSLYYMFFESQSNPENDPVVLWLNGGPGCSSLMGFVGQHGPFMFQPGSVKMAMNPYSWNKRANMIYLESPGGVGFSYASELYRKTNDTQTAKDNILALRLFFQKFPLYSANDFYIAGQSYAGIYVPMLAIEVLQYNEDIPDNRINFRGFLLGNPCTHPKQCYYQDVQSRFFSELLYNHGFIDQSLYNKFKGQCLINDRSSQCKKTQQDIYTVFQETGASIYNIYGMCYHPIYPGQIQNLLSEEKMQKYQKKIGIRNLKHPLRCSDAIGSLTLFNANQFRAALHVDQLNDTLPWTPCSDSIDYTVEPQGSFGLLPTLVKAGLKIFYFSGDQDAAVPLEGTIWWLKKYREQFGKSIKRSWRPWVVNNRDIAGMLWELEGLTFVTVIGAGHMVPTDKPIEAQQIFNVFLGYSQWKLPSYYEE